MGDIRRGFQVYKGPDDHNPFMGLINKLCFHNRHMMSFNQTGVFSLTIRNVIGRVTVMSVGPWDFIWTYGGKRKDLYIILVPDLIAGWQIPVLITKDDYTFLPLEAITVKTSRLAFGPDYAGTLGDSPRAQYMPYIFNYPDQLGTHHVSVGYEGNQFYFGPSDDWHYKFYVLDCTGNANSEDETLWKPPPHANTFGFGGGYGPTDLLPPWYSMSEATAHAYHWCLEAAIDQRKRTYQPMNTEVTLASPNLALAIPNFSIKSKEGMRYNFLYPLQLNRFYGKNAFDLELDPYTENSYIITAWGESIYVNGVGDFSQGEGTLPVLFFWPWVPYLDEIRCFNILAYGPSLNEAGDFEGYFKVTPELDTMRSWGIGYYTNLGQYLTQQLFKDSAIFSDVNRTLNNVSSDVAVPCGCGDCGTETNSQTTTTSIDPYSSSGTRYIPIGLIGGKIPISMKTTWTQHGTGPTSTDAYQGGVSGNYPYDSISLGSDLEDFYESCCITAFRNDASFTRTLNEVASNVITMQQVLSVGEDIIFSGESVMNYSMTRELSESYSGFIQSVVIPPADTNCEGAIGFTTQDMAFSETQNLSWSDQTVYRPCQEGAFTFSWSLAGGGSLSSYTEQNTVYTAPSSNSNCENNAVISLLCNGLVVDTLEIAIHAPNYATSLAYEFHGACEQGCFQTWLGYYWNCEYRYWYDKTVYHCDGTVHSGPVETGCGNASGGCQYWPCVEGIKAVADGGAACVAAGGCCNTYTQGIVDVRSDALKSSGCCPAGLL